MAVNEAFVQIENLAIQTKVMEPIPNRGGAGAFRGLDELVASMGFSAEVRVRTIDLIRSNLSKDGARYSVVSSAKLAT